MRGASISADKAIVRVILCLSCLVCSARLLPGPVDSGCRLFGQAIDYSRAEELYLKSQYEECSAACQTAINNGEYHENWRLLKIEADWARGDVEAAFATWEASLRRYVTSPRMRWIGIRLCRESGWTARYQQLRLELSNLLQQYPYVLTDPAARVAAGQFLLAEGADARQVLEQFFDRAKKARPEFIEPYLAAGQLALDKHDYRVAAQEFQKALQIHSAHPQALFGLVQAYAPSDAEKAEHYLHATLAQNPHYVPALLWLAERHIDAERYREAEELLDHVEQINPETPECWALRSVIAHLESRPDEAELFRRIALGWWSDNPKIHWLIGRKLSQHYRFAEGASHQRQALQADAQYLPARFQLAQDLMRLGDSTGWQLIREVFQSDPYNVVAHNLVKLSQRMDSFTVLHAGPIRLRMDKKEAEVYGKLALDLLLSATDVLSRKYQHVIEEPVWVEVFPEQADFAIRTFGLPGGEGFLGVCFGSVITANSPSAQGATPSNWQAVLWHELCHVITLQKTRNKMPRWLSEGISVYEERLANAAWGEAMTPQYRQWILEGRLTPIGRMNTAFLEPESPLHLQFAYYQASLVVEFLVEQYGLAALVGVLDDLGQGVLINESLSRRARPLPELEREFTQFAKEKAERFGAGIDWSEPDRAVRQDRQKLEEWLTEHANSYYAVVERVKELFRQQRWQEARQILEPLVEQCEGVRGSDSPAALLAVACRGLADVSAERAALERVAKYSDRAVDVYDRLIELARQVEDWQSVWENCRRALAVQPMRASLQRTYAEAAEQLGRSDEVLAAYRALLALDPVDPADLHYRAAMWSRNMGRLGEAKRHVLQALEEAPRFRAAQDLLWELVHAEDQAGRTETQMPPSAR